MRDFRGLHDVLGVRECRDGFVVYEFCVAAGVIEVKVRVDDQIDLIGTDACGGEIADEWIAFLDAVDIAEFGCPLRAVTGFDENSFVFGAD